MISGREKKIQTLIKRQTLHYNTRNENLIYKILVKREQHIDYSFSTLIISQATQ
jgi:hypothetical protein